MRTRKSLPYSFLDPCTRNYHKCYGENRLRLESMCGKKEEDQIIIAWSAKPSNEHFCFVVNENEFTLVFEGGQLVEKVVRPGSYKFERKSGVSITWVLKNSFQMEYGVRKSDNVISKDGKTVGFHGTATLFVRNVERFVNQFRGEEKVTTDTLKGLIRSYLTDAFRALIRDLDKKEFMGKRSDEMFLKKIVDRLYPLFEAYGIEITDITIEGFVDC